MGKERILRGNDCVVDTIDNPRMWHLINDACVLTEREPKMAEITKVVSGRGWDPVLLVSGRATVTEGELTVYNNQGARGGSDTNAYTPGSTLRE